MSSDHFLIENLALGIPLHNGERWLDNLSKNLKSQEYLPSKILLLDDGSDIDLKIKLENAFNWYHGSLLINRVYPAIGVASAYNFLANLAKDMEFMHILDQDDSISNDFYKYLAKNKFLLERLDRILIAGLRSNNFLLNFFGLAVGSIIRKPQPIPKSMPLLGWIATRSGVIYPTQKLIESPFPSPAFSGSDIIHLHTIRQLCESVYLPDIYVRYRIHGSAISKNVKFHPIKVSKLYWLESALRYLISRVIR